jgi:dTDP-4-dehydrorhamnose reductase
MRVAVTGAGGRLGSSLVSQLASTSDVSEVLQWDLPQHDLDDPGSADRLLRLNRPDVVIHAAAWTDVDGCARDPGLALRRNGEATGEMARACVANGSALVAISTNEVFDGLRKDGLPYQPTDLPSPGNPYGAAKLAGEQAARHAFGADADVFAVGASGRSVDPGPALAIVRTAWLFGPPGIDFTHKIVAAAAKARAAGRPLDLVSDEIGCPTYAPDLAGALVAIARELGRPGGQGVWGIHHIVNGGHASRAEWAREILRLSGIVIETNDVPLATWPRPSTPPAFGVLASTPLPNGPLRLWQEATAEYLRSIASTTEVKL